MSTKGPLVTVRRTIDAARQVKVGSIVKELIRSRQIGSDQIELGFLRPTHLFACTPGPLNLNAAPYTVKTENASLWIVFSGSGYRNGSLGRIGCELLVDGVPVATSASYTNENLSHKAFVPNSVVMDGFAKGRVVQFSLGGAFGATSTDGNDFFTLTVTEVRRPT